ncbi:Oxysterol-binding protein-like protein [Smittium mucronatum]|uniref:Oxysterol-binding protein-like protein n=1 Tax=Smittium mucronatum TaxID=133383 RepID=A0A1R0GQY3_9FUNG|nr:Oxysterol-binding protein-like protein [Smittium mucronatum]
MEAENKSDQDNQNYVHTKKYLEVLKAFENDDIESVKKLVPYWIEAFNEAQKKSKRPDNMISTTFEKSTPLHLAVQCANVDIIKFLLDYDNHVIPIDFKDPYGNTALHYAVKASRKEAVLLLLEAGADDDILDSNNQTPLMIAPNLDIENIIFDYHNRKIGDATTHLFSLALKGNVKEISSLIEAPGYENKVNLLARNTSDGKTLLHIAAEKDNIELAKWAIKNGISLFSSDFNNKLAYSYAKSPEMIDLISKASSTTESNINSDVAPKYSGMLDKWTNYAGGWKGRWFELESGVLSYYKNKDDAENSCRGAINLKIARVALGMKDKRQFEVIGKGSVKYQLRAKSISEAKQWIHMLNLSKLWAVEKLKNIDEHSPPADTVSEYPESEIRSIRNQHIEISQKKSYPSSVYRKASDFDGVKAASINLKRLTLHSDPDLDMGFKSSSMNLNMSGASVYTSHQSSNFKNVQITNSNLMNMSMTKNDSTSGGSSYSDVDSILESNDRHEEFFSANSIAQNQVRTLQIVSRELSLLKEDESNWTIAKDYSSNIIETLSLLESKLSQMKKLFESCNLHWNSKLSNELKRIDTLTETLQSAVMDTQKVGTELLSKLSKSSAATPHGTGNSNFPALKSIAESNEKLDNKDKDFDESEEEDDDDDDDEFADAYDSFANIDDPNKFPVDPVPDNLASQPELDNLVESTGDLEDQDYNLDGYGPEYKLRKNLPSGEGKKPSFSLWSIIKNAIGKDLSKISVPVFFNEPSSFLQRFTEDMEYSDLLELASRLPQSADRTMLVASFAMSNYSSTFGRVAKPFNPLLGETYEYVRGDKLYRAFSEQVVHHPPISAMWVEALNYTFHADTSMKSKFTGKSLEITPDCVCHVYLRVPIEFLDKGSDSKLGPRLSQPKIVEGNTHFIEHYSWRKISTSVNGIITGSFWIEHFGDLEVINHSTGDKTVLTFKKSGWLGDNKYKIEGSSKNRNGATTHLISGNWVSQIIAKPVTSSSEKNFDVTGNKNEVYDRSLIDSPAFKNNPTVADSDNHVSSGSNSSDKDSKAGGYNKAIVEPISLPSGPFVLWKKNEIKNHDSTYHFTDFAVTLNEIDDDLAKYVAPSDSRFRPDQRAMEIEKYDVADTEKTRLEEKQRKVRKMREAGELEQWKPKWFVPDVDPDTGCKFWKFTGEYWNERQKVASEINEGKKDVVWKDVPDIF